MRLPPGASCRAAGLLFERRIGRRNERRRGRGSQFVFCIDEREESIRRALEEQHPGYITYGVAGFFGVAIDYQGLYDRQPAAHCPVVVTPAHEVYEGAVDTDLEWHTLRRRLRDRWHGWERKAAASSRTLSGGAGMSLLLGPLSGMKTLAQLLAPRSYGRFGDRLKARMAPRPRTRLSPLRVTAAGDRPGGRKPIGFSLAESVDRVTAVLRNIGLVGDFAPVIVFLGHGSTSLNNPHESAHDCGACGGRRGGANARLFADLANRPEVRAGVRDRGIDIPADTWFVGALHDTADDSITCFDLESVPLSLTPPFDEAVQGARAGAARERPRTKPALSRCAAHAVAGRGAASRRSALDPFRAAQAGVRSLHQLELRRRTARDDRVGCTSIGAPSWSATIRRSMPTTASSSGFSPRSDRSARGSAWSITFPPSTTRPSAAAPSCRTTSPG